MLKLIRLEWKKNNVGKYIRNVVIMSALVLPMILIRVFLTQHRATVRFLPASSCLQAWHFWCLPALCCPHTL